MVKTTGVGKIDYSIHFDQDTGQQFVGGNWMLIP